MKKILLLLIIILAAFLRLYNLSDTPPGVNRDEASIGVTAYSLMTTGRDEYGRTFPLSFESFGDWKLPLYIYATIPFVKIFGLNELAVRLPSAMFGIASVAAIFFLARELFASETLALMAAFILSVIPWHIHISRVESEAIVAVFFTIIGSGQFITATKKKSLSKLVTAALLFSTTYYTYHGNHISTSLLIAGLFIIYWRDMIKIPKWWIAVGIGAITTLLILSVTVTADNTKISGISIFGDPTVIHKHIELPRLMHDNPNSLEARLIHNRLTYAAVTIFQNYLKSYGPEFLFIRGGGNSAHNISGYGNLHPIEAPLLLLGVVWLMTLIRKKEAKYIVWWLAIGGVAAAITKDAPHSNRMLAVVPALAIAVAAGLWQTFSLIPKKMHAAIAGVILFGYLCAMGNYLDRYFVHFPKTEAKNWGYAYQKLTPILFSQKNSGKTIIMTHPEKSPYIYLMFYSQYSPADYQREAKRYPISRDGFTDISGFGRFIFRPIDWDRDLARHNTLLVTEADEMPAALSQKIIATIRLPDNSIQFIVLDTDK